MKKTALHKTVAMVLLGWVWGACDLTLPERTCSSSSDCEPHEFCSPSGFCLNWDPIWEDANVDIQDGVDADGIVSCEPGEIFCDNRQILICNEDGESTTDGDLCDLDKRCREGIAQCVDRCTEYGSPCEGDDDCRDGPDCTGGELQCLNDVCVTSPPGVSGDPCWDDLECGEQASNCYEPVDVCQAGEVGEPCVSVDDCAESLVC